jgi:DNA (cytosine-5)-methyltransferase 1
MAEVAPFSVVSTFAGCGGSSLGYMLAGGKMRLAVEWDNGAADIYRRNHPATPLFHGDIGSLTVEQALETAGVAPGELDVFDGSPPCQGFSTSGRRQFEDQRNQLFRQYVRLLQGFRPKAFVMENVSGMVAGKMRIIFAEVLRELQASGYRVVARKLNAAHYGVPQARQRMIFIGARNDLGIEPTHPAPTHAPISARKALEGLRLDEQEVSTLLEIAKSKAIYKSWEFMKPGSNLTRLGLKNGFNTVRVDPMRPAPTLTKSAAYLGFGGLMHWAEQRPFTVAELKRLSSFPDNYDFGPNYVNAVERLGNTVPPLFMKAIASHVRDTIVRRSA